MSRRKPARPAPAERSPQILRAVLRLRELILTGALAAGKRVPELELVGPTGVSRTPLRIAMERLAHEGLLERRARGGFIVRAFARTEIEQALEIRGVLEGTAARLAAERADNAQAVETVRELADRLDRVVAALPAFSAFEQYVQINEAFHAALVGAAASEMLRTLLAQVQALPFASPSAFVRLHAMRPESRAVLLTAQEHHRTIVDAVACHEGGRAEGIAREHARLALKNLDFAFADRDRLGRLPGSALIRAV